MDTISYTAFRKDLARTLDKVNDDHVPIMITRQQGEPAVVMSVDDFKSYEETAYLMTSLTNAQRLNESVAEIEAGQAKQRELTKEDDLKG